MKHLLLVLPLLLPLSAHAQDWNNPDSKTFATCLARGDKGDWWMGADDKGLYHLTPNGQGAPFAGQAELGDDSVTCLTIDRAHRLWVGTPHAGVAVYNGANWKRFGVWNGPLSSRVNALKVDASGAVWGATDAGVFRWSQSEGWSYPGVFALDAATRKAAQRPVYALAIESPRSILLAGDDGLRRLTLVGSTAHVERLGQAAPLQQPPSARGLGFLPGPVHDVTLDTRGQIWCATRFGVCLSKNKGATWQFLRGDDWKANAKGNAVPLSIQTVKTPQEPLSEDWVTTLSPASNGKMWLGFRQKGAEERDCRTLDLLVTTQDDPKFATNPAFVGDWVSAIVPLGSDIAAFARYGGGAATLFATAPTDEAAADDSPNAPLPQDALTKPALVAALLADLPKRTPVSVGGGAFYSLDRETRGDWPLRYGNKGGELMGIGEDESYLDPPGFWRTESIGPHRLGGEVGDTIYSYTFAETSTNPNVVQLPWKNKRTQSEINDGTWQNDVYPYSFDGPDLWVTFQVPAGLHRVALYWYNKDAHSGDNRMRDHRVQLFSGNLSPAACLRTAPLATTRLWSGWSGEYASFAVRGPAKFQIRIARDRSHATILQALFFDRLGARPSKPAWVPARLKMPKAPALPSPASQTPAQKLWRTCDQAETRGIPCPIERLIALRAAKSEGLSDQTLAPWRIQATLWDESNADRQTVALPRGGK